MDKPIDKGLQKFTDFKNGYDLVCYYLQEKFKQTFQSQLIGM